MSTSYRGLTEKKAAQLLRELGPNELTQTARVSLLTIFLSQFANVLMLLLAVAASVSFIANEWVDGVFILLIIMFNALLGFLQEFKADHAITELRKMTKTSVRVIRDGEEELIDSRFLVPGDIIKLAEGDRIPADCKVVDALHIEINEASISGESLPVAKNTHDPDKNSVFMGTIVSSGKAVVKVTSTGMRSRFGHIAASLSSITKEETPLSRKITTLGKQLTAIAVIIVLVFFATGLATHRPIVDLLLTSISLAVAAVPEGLPAVITITLAIGLQRMAKKKAILRKLSAIEALGNTTVIATDKTGTLTENKMRVVSFWIDEAVYERDTFASYSKTATAKLLLQCGIICNDANLIVESDHATTEILGDQTEGSLLLLAKELGVEPETIRERGNTVAEFPFDAMLKRMSVVWDEHNKLTVFTKGAPESVLTISTHIYQHGHAVPISSHRKQQIEKQIAAFATKGLRVLALASRNIDRVADGRETAEKDLTFLGLVGIADPPRANVAETIRIARNAGIETIMITGDNPITAKSIGVTIGLIDSEGVVVTGDELHAMSDGELSRVLDTTRVFARTVPEDKHRIVSMLQKKGHVVTATGDGVNDALAIKQADVGVAMGITGTDVAKEVADMVITDDNFVSIVNAVREGRVIFTNIVKSIVYLVSCNLGEIFTLCVGIALNLPVPLLPIQILWINLVTDGLPALSLAFDPGGDDIMRKRSIRSNNAIIGRHNLPFITVASLIIGVITLGLFAYTLNNAPLPYARMVAFNTLIILQMIMAFVVRKNEPIFSNPLLSTTIGISLIIQILITVLAPLRIFFHFQ